MKKVVAIKVVKWDLFNPAYECCREVVSRKFGAVGGIGDGGVIWQSQPCGQCGKSWNVVKGGPQDEDKPRYIFRKEWKSKRDVPLGWTIIE